MLPKTSQDIGGAIGKMGARKTDLALEAKELWQEQAGETTKLSGVKARDGEREGMPVTTVEILDAEGEKALGKPKGTYVTVTLEGVARRAEDAFGRASRAGAAELTGLLGELTEDGLVLVAGLGNRAITPDAVGPKVHEHILGTRHLVAQMPEQFCMENCRLCLSGIVILYSQLN